MDNIETRVAQTILQSPTEVTVRGTTYSVAPPSVATLILVSEAVARLPQGALDRSQVLEETLSVARHCRPIGDVAAILILGAKGLTREEPRCGALGRMLGLMRTVDAKSALADAVLEDYTPEGLLDLLSGLFAGMQVQDFFGITTFLTEANLLRPTKVVETTRSGR